MSELAKCPFPGFGSSAPVDSPSLDDQALHRTASQVYGNPCLVFSKDLFGREALADPYPLYKELRDTGPAVRLGDPACYVLSRFKDVRDALRSPGSLICSDGVGFSDAFNVRRLPNLLASDGGEHQRMRNEIMRQLAPAALQKHRASMAEMVSNQVKRLVNQGVFDAMSEIARFLPVAVISHLVGLPEAGRADMLDWAAATFDAVGPGRLVTDWDRKTVAAWRQYLGGLKWSEILPGSWGRMLEEGVAAERLSADEAQGYSVLMSYQASIRRSCRRVCCCTTWPKIQISGRC